MQVKLLHSGKNVEVKEVGSFNPKPYVREKLEVGETGYFTANIKIAAGSEDGRHHHGFAQSLGGAARLQGNSSDGVQRNLSDQHRGLRTSKANLGKLQLNDSAFAYQSESSVALGFGFRCGFLGLAAPGNRAGASAARIRHGHHRHLSQRRLSRDA